MNTKEVKFTVKARELGYSWVDISKCLNIAEGVLKYNTKGRIVKIPLDESDLYKEYLLEVSDPKLESLVQPIEPMQPTEPIVQPDPKLDLIAALDLVNSTRATCTSIDTFESLVDLTEDNKIEIFRKYAGKNFLNHLPDDYARVDLLDICLEWCKEMVEKFNGVSIQATYIKKVKELEERLEKLSS